MQDENQKAIDNAMFKKLEQLAIKMPNDPILYKEDVNKYKELFKIEFQKIQGDTMKKNQRFGQLLIFLSKSVRFFPETLGFIPTTTMSLMNELGKSLHHYNRKKCISSIMILRAKNILYPISTIQFLLRQFNIEDKMLRVILYKYIVNDLRRMNKHHKNNQINQELKKYISQYITKYSDKTAQKSLQIMIDLYKRNIWTDNRTVNIIADGCFNASSKIRLIACLFLVSTTQPLQQLSESDSDDDIKAQNPSDIKFIKGIRRHTKNNEKKIGKEKKRAQRRIRKKQIASRNENFMPIDLIYSPQEFAQKLFNHMNQKQTRFIHKIFYMALISRIIWRHKLIILPFYGALQRYMDPRQKEAPKILAYFAESVHDLVPDDQIEPIVKHIIETFVNDKCSEFAMTIGLNTLREVYIKVPSIITEDSMTYICTYYEYKNKNVSMATKSIINLVREINPYLLQKKYRGKHANEPLDLSQKQAVGTRIKGAALLGLDQGSMPIQMMKIFTDEDFKRMRKLIKKQQEQDGWGDDVDQQVIQDVDLGDQQVEQIQDQAEQGDNSQNSDYEEMQIEDEDQIDWDDAEQLDQDAQQFDEEGQQIDQEQAHQDQDGSQEIQIQDDGSQLEFQGEDQQQQESKKKNTKKTKKIVKADKAEPIKTQNKQKSKKKTKKQLFDSDSDEQSSEQHNPHGFIGVNNIAFYKQSKTQKKAQMRKNPQLKQKFKHKPKEKKGGQTNEQKAKRKPIMMTRNKKNKLKLRQKQVKIRIKSLKTQLGKVRSNKQATRKKNRKVVTK